MTPTLLELVVAIFLLWVAWHCAVVIAPRIVASFLRYWRSPRSSRDFDPSPFEKNITPPVPPSDRPSRTHE